MARAICTDHDAVYFDFAGNALLAFEIVYIERAVANTPRSETRALDFSDRTSIFSLAMHNL